MKALDIYLAVCFFMVFGALLEYATVSYVGKRIKINIKRHEEFRVKVRRREVERVVILRAGGGAEAGVVETESPGGEVSLPLSQSDQAASTASPHLAP